MTDSSNIPNDSKADPITNSSLRRAKEESAAARSNLKADADADIITKNATEPMDDGRTAVPPFVEDNSFDHVIERGCNWGIFPLLFVFANKLVWNQITSRDSYHNDPQPFLADLISNSTLALYALLADVAVLYKFIEYVKKEIIAFEADSAEASAKEASMEEGEVSQQEAIASANASSTTTTTRFSVPKYPYARLTRKLDDFLMGSSSPPPKVPTTIGLLYMLMVCCAAGSLASLGVRIYAGTEAAETDCTLFPSPRDQLLKEVDEDHKIAGIPEGLQSWAVGLAKNGVSEFSGSYVHMADGMTYFGGALERTRTPEADDDNNWRGHANREIIRFGKKKAPIKVMFSTNQQGILQKHLGVGNPRDFVAVKGDNPDLVETFCCTYDDHEVMNLPTRNFGLVPRRFLCSSSGDMHEGQGEVLRNRSLTVVERLADLNPRGPVMLEFETIKAFEGDLWHAALWRIFLSRKYNKKERLLEFYKINPLTMERQSIANVTGSVPSSGRNIMEEFGKGLSDANACSSWVSTITSILVAMVTFPAAYLLVRQKGVSAGVAPAVMTTCYVINAISEELLNCVSFLVTLATTIMLVQQPPNWLDRGILIWSHYAVFCYLFILAMCHDFDPDYSMAQMFWGILLGAVLNHRTLEGVGCTFGIFMTYIFIHQCADGFCPSEVFFILPMGAFIACGMITTGLQLRKYHPYIAFTLQRFLRQLKDAIPPDGSRGNEDDLTRRLINARS